MADNRNIGAKTRPDVLAPHDSSPAKHTALAIVPDIVVSLDPAVLKKLHDAVLSPRPETARGALAEVIESGIKRVDLADLYIPAIARELGDRWCSDEVSFAAVTIGSSRLQSMLRALGPNWSGENTGQCDAASILLVVPQDVYHTLGALVLGGQLRREGYSVKLVLGGKPQDIAAGIKRTKYEAIFISSSRGETLESLRRIIEAVKSSVQNAPPIVVGGTILDVESKENVTTLTGADFATKIPQEALRLCGLRLTTQHNTKIKFGV
jgi:methanogenic corrinoid protein MtbC1